VLRACEAGIEGQQSSSNMAMDKKLIDLTGKIFGRLTVVSRVENDKRGMTRWLCTCTCGSKKVIFGQKLRYGEIRSCGCLFQERKSLAGEGEQHLDAANS
jgi:hypothetical protein